MKNRKPRKLKKRLEKELQKEIILRKKMWRTSIVTATGMAVCKALEKMIAEKTATLQSAK